VRQSPYPLIAEKRFGIERRTRVCGNGYPIWECRKHKAASLPLGLLCEIKELSSHRQASTTPPVLARVVDYCSFPSGYLRVHCRVLAEPAAVALGAHRAIRRRRYRRATAILDVVVTADLPDDIKEIVKFLAGWARGYNNRLKWNEEAKIKSDMMGVPERWTPERAPVDAVKAACLEAGMTEQDTKTIVDLLRKRQAGKRLVPHRSYKGFRFSPPVE
jgi:hypothetical protein